MYFDNGKVKTYDSSTLFFSDKGFEAKSNVTCFCIKLPLNLAHVVGYYIYITPFVGRI